MRCTEETLTPTASAIAAPVQCVASAGGSIVSATTRWAKAGSSFLDARRPRLVAQQAFEAPRRRSVPASARRRSWTCRSRARSRSCPPLRRSATRSRRAKHASVERSDLEPTHTADQDRRGGRKEKCCFASPDSHPANQPGIPKGIPMSDLIHEVFAVRTISCSAADPAGGVAAIAA
jgi:hypothetical protein